MRLRRAASLAALVVSSSFVPLSIAPVARAARLDLPALQALAEAQAPRLMLARQEIGLARAELAAADPSFPDNPVLDLAVGPRVSGDGTGLAVDATFLQAFFFDGQRGARRLAAKQAVLTAEARVEVARWSLHADLHRAFDRALVARERVTLEAEVADFQTRLADIASKKAKAGEIAEVDARLAAVERIEARQHLVAAQADYLQACLQLATLVGWQRDEALEPEGTLEQPTAPPLQALRRHALAADPELRLKSAAIALAEARLDFERRSAGVLPAFGLSVGHETGLGAEPSVTTVQGVLSLPLPTSNTNQAGVARARAELELARTERSTYQQELLARVAELHAALTSAIERAAAFESEILPRNAELLTLLERAYAVGELELGEAIVARERFVRVRLDALEAAQERLAARAELERLLGADLEEVAR